MVFWHAFFEITRLALLRYISPECLLLLLARRNSRKTFHSSFIEFMNKKFRVRL